MVQTVELPRVPGYVETVVGGRHVYRNIETGEITDHPTPPKPAIPTIADRDYDADEYMMVGGVLYRVLLPILAGSRITIGTNVEATTIEAEMANLNKEES